METLTPQPQPELSQRQLDTLAITALRMANVSVDPGDNRPYLEIAEALGIDIMPDSEV